MKIKLEHVHYMPKKLNPGVLYVSREFKTAAHLCACGCGTKIRTPLGPTEWTLSEAGGVPTLRPSIGNWQQACRSHYWISAGKIQWAEQWTSEQISKGRKQEEQRRQAYYNRRNQENKERKAKYSGRIGSAQGIASRIWSWFKGLFN